MPWCKQPYFRETEFIGIHWILGLILQFYFRNSWGSFMKKKRKRWVGRAINYQLFIAVNNEVRSLLSSSEFWRLLKLWYRPWYFGAMADREKNSYWKFSLHSLFSNQYSILLISRNYHLHVFDFFFIKALSRGKLL